MFKAIARMCRDGKEWTTVIYPAYKTFAEAEKAARAFAQKYDFCLWVQVLPA